MSLAKLSIDLEARLAGLQEGMDKAALMAQRNADRIEASFNGIKQSAVAVGTVLAGAFAGFSLGSVVKTAIDAADHLNDLSKATGIAVETLGGIGFAASQAGTDLDGVAASLGKLNLAIAKAGSGDKDMASAFGAMGVAIRDTEGRLRSADKVFADVSAKFAGYADGPNKAALANQLFGKSYSSVLPLLADGGTALRDNIAYYERFAGVTTETARAADEFNDTLGKLSLITGSFGRKLAADLLPTLQAIADELLKSKEAGGQFAVAGGLLAEAFKATTVFGANVLFVLTSIGRELGAIGAQAAAAVRGDWAGFNAISQAVKEDGERARAELDKFERRVLQSAQIGLNTGSGPRGASAALADAPAIGGGGGGSAGGSRAGRDRAAVQGLLADRQEAFRAAELSIQQSVEEALRTGQLRDLERERADALAAIAERQSQLNALIAATPTAKLEEERQAMLLLADAFERGAITAEQFSEAASTRLGNIAPESKAQLDEMSTFANQAARNIQDALGNTLEATLSGNFENIGQMWKSLLIRMAAEAAAAQIGKELFGNFGSGSNSAGGGGGMISELIKLLPMLFSAKGHGFAGGAQAFAAGGILGPYGGMLTRPTVFPMANGGIGIGGEAGTEAVMPLKRGRDGKLGVAAASGGGMVVNLQVVNHIDSRSDAGAISLLVAEGVRQGQRQMLDYLRARGVAA
jgi:hypothetical protein